MISYPDSEEDFGTSRIDRIVVFCRSGAMLEVMEGCDDYSQVSLTVEQVDKLIAYLAGQREAMAAA